MEAASKLFHELALEPDRQVRASALTDIGLIKAGVRRLGELVIPSSAEGQQGFAENLRKGRADFELALKAWNDVPGGHASFALGVLALSERNFSQAVSHLDSALTFFESSPLIYQRDNSLSLARLYLGLSICNTMNDAGRLPRACELIPLGLDGGASLPLALLPDTLVSLTLVRDDLTVAIADVILAAAGSQALDQILDSTSGRRSEAVMNALFRRATDPKRGVRLRAEDHRRVLPMLLLVGDTERACDALDYLELQAESGIDVDEFLRLLESTENYSPAWDVERARESSLYLLVCAGRIEDASSIMEGVCYHALATEDEHALDDAILILGHLEDFGPRAGEAVSRLKPLVDARLLGNEDEVTLSDSEDQTAVRILVVGGDERQERMDKDIVASVRTTLPHVEVEFMHTGWSGNWRTHADKFARTINRYDGVIFLYLMRTMLGRNIRQQCQLPWRGCGRGGQGAITGAIFRVVPVAQRRLRSRVQALSPKATRPA